MAAADLKESIFNRPIFDQFLVHKYIIRKVRYNYNKAYMPNSYLDNNSRF